MSKPAWGALLALCVCGFATPPPDALSAGRTLFERNCALCHGMDGSGGRGPNLRRAKLNRASDDAALKTLISEGIGTEMPPAWSLTDDELANVVVYVRSLGKVAPEASPGDASHGARLFAQRGCSGCHIVAGQGTGFGPELTDVGARRSPKWIRQAIVKPEAALPDGFMLVEARTAAGESIRGVRVNEDTFTIQVRDQSGRFHSLRKSDVAELRKIRDATPMPSFGETLSSAELDDLVAYLASQRGEP